MLFLLFSFGGYNFFLLFLRAHIILRCCY
jgi:hypothetical protein